MQNLLPSFYWAIHCLPSKNKAWQGSCGAEAYLDRGRSLTSIDNLVPFDLWSYPEGNDW